MQRKQKMRNMMMKNTLTVEHLDLACPDDAVEIVGLMLKDE